MQLFEMILPGPAERFQNQYPIGISSGAVPNANNLRYCLL